MAKRIIFEQGDGGTYYETGNGEVVRGTPWGAALYHRLPESVANPAERPEVRFVPTGESVKKGQYFIGNFGNMTHASCDYPEHPGYTRHEIEPDPPLEITLVRGDKCTDAYASDAKYSGDDLVRVLHRGYYYVRRSPEECDA